MNEEPLKRPRTLLEEPSHPLFASPPKGPETEPDTPVDDCFSNIADQEEPNDSK